MCPGGHDPANPARRLGSPLASRSQFPGGMLPLLPLLAVAAARPSVHVDTQADLERMLADAVRARVARGWTLAAVDGDEQSVTYVVTRKGVAERHIAVIDDRGNGGSYRVERTAARGWLGRAPDDLALEMARAPRGGLEFVMGCGDWYDRAYVIDAEAIGDAAGTLVAHALGDGELVEASSTGDEARFAIARGDANVSLVVGLDDRHRVVAAELRRYEWLDDHVSYARQDALADALEDARVSAIDGDDLDAPVLVLAGGRRFAIDPDAAAFVEDPRDPDDTGCGC